MAKLINLEDLSRFKQNTDVLLAEKMDKVNPEGSGSLSINRLDNTIKGASSVAIGVGEDVTRDLDNIGLTFVSQEDVTYTATFTAVGSVTYGVTGQKLDFNDGTNEFTLPIVSSVWQSGSNFTLVLDNNENKYTFDENESYVATKTYGSFKAVATGKGSVAIGSGASATGAGAVAIGAGNVASGQNSVAIGSNNKTTGLESCAVGTSNKVNGYAAFAEGYGNTVSAGESHAEGVQNTVSGSYSHVEGYANNNAGSQAHLEGGSNTATASAYQAHGEGYSNTVSASAAHVEGSGNTASGSSSHAEGSSTLASGSNSHAEGYNTQATGEPSHAEGTNTKATGWNSHAEGQGSQATQNNSHAEGMNSKASGYHSHAEGEGGEASGGSAHKEGFYSKATGNYSHAEGASTTAKGASSHAEGGSTEAKSNNSHAEGYNTIASSTEQHVQGRYNIEDAGGIYADIIGNGTTSARSNAATVDWSGNAWFAGDVKVGSEATLLTKEKELKLTKDKWANSVGFNDYTNYLVGATVWQADKMIGTTTLADAINGTWECEISEGGWLSCGYNIASVNIEAMKGKTIEFGSLEYAATASSTYRFSIEITTSSTSGVTRYLDGSGSNWHSGSELFEQNHAESIRLVIPDDCTSLKFLIQQASNSTVSAGTISVTNTYAFDANEYDISDEDNTILHFYRLKTTDPISSYANNAVYLLNDGTIQITNNVGTPVTYGDKQSIAELTDVDLDTLVDGDILVYDAVNSKWVNQAFPSLVESITDLDDINFTNLTDGQLLRYDNNSQKWVNSNEITGHTVMDSLGGEMTQRKYLKIKGANIEDVTTDADGKNKTVVTINLDSLDNTNIGAAGNPLQNGQTLKYDSTSGKWVNGLDTDLGHIIQNASGTSLTQRDYLKFEGLDVVDEKDNSDVSTNTTKVSASLNSLTDTDINSPTNGQILRYEVDAQTGESAWKNGTNSLDNLSNVGSGAAVAGQVLTKGQDGIWRGADIPASDIEDLENVTITLPQDGEVLTYDGTNEIWKNTELTIPSSLDDLSDVDTTGYQDGEVLTYSSSEGKWIGAEIPEPTIPSHLSDLDDVTGTPSAGQVLTYNNGEWSGEDLPDVPSSLDDLSDVNVTGVASGKFLKYDGNAWVPGDASAGGASDLGDLGDVTLTSPSEGQVLKYNGTEWVNGTDNDTTYTGTGLITVNSSTHVISTSATDNEGTVTGVKIGTGSAIEPDEDGIVTLPAYPAIATSDPANVGTSASAGSSTKYAKEDHVHKIALDTGNTDGTVKIAGQEVSVKGLKSAAYKDTTDTYSSTGTDPVTGRAVAEAIAPLVGSMIFKGTVGTDGTIAWASLPAAASGNKGNEYKVVSNHDTAPICKTGDTIISDGTSWVVIPSGDEPSGTVTSVQIKATSPIVVDSDAAITSSGVRTLSHENSGADAGSYGDSIAQTPSYGGTFKVPYITVDAKGHVTEISDHTVKIPASDDTTYTLSVLPNNLVLSSSEPGDAPQKVSLNNIMKCLPLEDVGSTILGDEDCYIGEAPGDQGSANATYWRSPVIKIWNYIKSKLGFSSSGSATKYLNQQGGWTTPPDTKVTAVENHYTPSGGSAKTPTGDTDTNITNLASGSGAQVISGITVDAAGHITGLTSKKLRSTDTDTKVTSVTNHYAPTEDASAKLSADASSSTAATWNSTALVTGVDIKRDAKGHVVGVAVDSIKMPANPTPINIITGSGTSGHLVKFNGTNTVTNGPALGTNTSQYLRNDGQWATPTVSIPVNPSSTTGLTLWIEA